MDGTNDLLTLSPESSILKEPVITKQSVKDASAVLRKYKEGKQNLDARVVKNEEWWRLRHWRQIRAKDGKPVDPSQDASSAWLLNGVLSKHADAMDSYPEFNCLPRESGDEMEAKTLSSILPVILEENNFEESYSNAWLDKLNNGTGCYKVFWDKYKLNNIGDISIESVDILNLFWEPGVSDIQDSPNFFQVQLCSIDEMKTSYSNLSETDIKGFSIDVAKYISDDTIDTSDKCAVIHWYYKKNGLLHYCQYCNETVLFASENDPEAYPNGWYAHGMYPFVFDVLYPIKGSPAGFGYIDIGMRAQEQIDRLNNAITLNAIVSATKRYLYRESVGINKEDFADLSKTLIEFTGGLDDTSFRELRSDSLSSTYITVLNNKIEELKETSGNRDVNNGGTTSGATAASAIAAMQESAGKLSRDMIKASYRAYRKIITMCIEMIRQFYDIPRQFRIIGEEGAFEYINFTNQGMQGTPIYGVDGTLSGYRLPVFDIEVTAQKASPYSKMAQNELALQFYNAGFFNPQIAEQAEICIDMMDFKGKEKILQKIKQNAMMYNMLQQMMQRVAQLEGMLGIAPEADQVSRGSSGGTNAGKADVSAVKSADSTDQAGVVKKARERSSATTEPR